MPLVVLCGRPCVGKTAFAHALAAHLSDAGGGAESDARAGDAAAQQRPAPRRVVIVNEESLGIDKASAYASESHMSGGGGHR